MTARSATIELSQSPTEFWPVNVTEFLATANATNDSVALAMIDYLVQAVAASGGSIAVTPDFLGYGESSTTHNRTGTLYSKRTHAQDFATAWLATEKYIQDNAATTTRCTQLDSVVTTTGYDQGGYAIIPGALALERFGVRIWANFVGGAPIQPILQVGHFFSLFAPDFRTAAPEATLSPAPSLDLGLLKSILPFLGYAAFPNDTNTTGGRDYYLLREEWMDPTSDIATNAMEWFDTPATIGLDYVAFVPDNVTEMFNADLRDLYAAARAQGLDDPCTSTDEYVADLNNATSKLCQDIQEASLLEDMGEFD
jgi:hypothetical protein